MIHSHHSRRSPAPLIREFIDSNVRCVFWSPCFFSLKVSLILKADVRVSSDYDLVVGSGSEVSFPVRCVHMCMFLSSAEFLIDLPACNNRWVRNRNEQEKTRTNVFLVINRLSTFSRLRVCFSRPQERDICLTCCLYECTSCQTSFDHWLPPQKVSIWREKHKMRLVIRLKREEEIERRWFLIQVFPIGKREADEEGMEELDWMIGKAFSVHIQQHAYIRHSRGKQQATRMNRGRRHRSTHRKYTQSFWDATTSVKDCVTDN